MRQLERNARGKRPQFYETPGLDEAMAMIMVLANELTVVRDRLDTVEKVAAAKGVILDADIEAFEPDQATLEARELRRQDFLARLFYLARKQAAEVAGDDSQERYTKALDDIAVN
jgi:hypothetical protein